MDVIGRAGGVLRAVSSLEPGGATTSEVARIAALPRPTTHRLLTSLLGIGFVDRDDEGRWLLGPELYLMGETASRRYDVTQLAQPFVRQLAVATGESAFFSARRGDETVCLVREDGSFPVRSHVLYEGVRFPLGVASAGLAILAYLPDTEIGHLLSRGDLVAAHGPQHHPDEIRARVAETRRRGYAVNPGLVVEGSWGLGAAVFDQSGEPRWALSLTGIEQRFGQERRATMGELLLQAAHDLGTALRSR